MLTLERLKEVLHYDPTLDKWTWKVTNSNAAKIGTEAGSEKGRGYKFIHIDGRHYLCQRLVWLWHHGNLPEQMIDHADGDTSNNRISNLRLATSIKNGQNQRKRATPCTSQWKGASWDGKRKKWQCYITVNKKRIPLGRVDSEHDAASIYNLAAHKHFGEFAKFNEPEGEAIVFA